MQHEATAADMPAMHAEIGEQTRFRKTIGESDVYLFAGITGDLSPNHIDEVFMADSVYGRRIAHGAMLVGFMSTAAARFSDRSLAKGIDSTPVSLGYDRVRFVAAAYINDTLEVIYTLTAKDEALRRTVAHVEIRNQKGELIAVGEHVMKWVKAAPRVA